jgi:hypothetical protein
VFRFRFEGDGVLAANGVRTVFSLGGDATTIGRFDEGSDEGGRFSASEDCGDREGVL